MDLRVIDDFIPQPSLVNLENFLTRKMPWYFSTDGQSDSKQPLSLGTIREREDFGVVENYLLNILNHRGINTSFIRRSIHNCFRRLDKPAYHQDPGEVSYMFYLNSVWKRHWGAHTKFKSKKYHLSTKVYPKPGRLVIFNSKLWHKGTSPNFLMPSYIAGRFSIVFQG